MPIGVLFWVVFVIWLVLGFSWHWPNPNTPGYWRPFGGHLLLVALIFLIGWKLFGFLVQ